MSSANARTAVPSNSTPQGHPSRRDNQSVSSTVSSSRSERGSERANERGSERVSDRSDRASPAHPAVESAVTRLLVSIKQLLEALGSWSKLKVDEIHVSDVYVRLGNDFNLAVAAFSSFGIDMSELMDVPNDLRHVLEQCLAEDATQENLELYLPIVRQIITNLLQGLRGKQSIYRRIVSDHRHRSSDRATHERTDSRSSRSSRREREVGSGHRPQLSRTAAENDRDMGSRNGTQSSVKRREPSSAQTTPPSNAEVSFSGGLVAPAQEAITTPHQNGTQERSPQHRRERSNTSPTIPAPPIGADYFGMEATLPKPSATITAPAPPNPDIPAPQPEAPPPTLPQVPANVKRYSLVDKPVTAPVVVVDEPTSPRDLTPPLETPPLDAMQVPAMANSLAALKKSDTLERRASKRFSTYNITKMTNYSTRERPSRTGSNRRSLAVSSTLTPGELDVLTEVEEPDPTPRHSSQQRRNASGSTTPDRAATSPMPPLPSTPSKTPEPVPPSTGPSTSTPERPTENETVVETLPSSPPGSAFPVFLQLGREVKKVNIEPGLSFSSLRVLFVDKFSYNPGLENFPAIYIRDPSSGVQYELEDVDEVKEKCLLSLNIEPLDQIKQHIDAQISTLSQDLKELRTAVVATRQLSHTPTIVGHPLAESTPSRTRPTDRQFQHVARRLSRYAGDHSSDIPSPPLASQIAPQMTGQSLQPQITGGSVLSEYSSRVVADLKTQFDEVQNLRRDLGIMRQLYTEFMKTTKESLGTLRGQTQSVKQLANAKVGGARSYIDSGKKTLDTRSQNVLTEVEKLQDIVEGIKDDVLKRHVTPKPQHLKNIKNDITTVATELQSLSEHIMTIKPMWKKTWEEELQNIVEEQQFLSHQEEFLNDLLEDHKAVLEVYGHVEKVISIRGSARVPRNRSFRPPPADEGHNGLSTVMLEIRGATVDPERRLKAIEASQKNREKELATRSDELQAELTEFVGGKRLKMTGGAEEAERVRQRRNDTTMKAMFNGGVNSSAPSPPVGSVTLPSTP